MARETPDKNPDLHALRHEVDATRSKLLNGLLVVFGTVFVVLGVVGVLLPIVPTTPFLLLAAFCYAHSSERFYLWLLTNRFFGNYIRDWREKKGFTVRVKIWIISVMASTMGASTYFVPITLVRVLLIVTGIGVAIYIWRLPTKEENALEEDAT
jgi:hypothetical protein